MKIVLKNWKDKPSIVEIQDSATEIAVVEISGDQVLVYPKYYDSGYDTRIYDFFDGHGIFRVADLENIMINDERCLEVPRL